MSRWFIELSSSHVWQVTGAISAVQSFSLELHRLRWHHLSFFIFLLLLLLLPVGSSLCTLPFFHCVELRAWTQTHAVVFSCLLFSLRVCVCVQHSSRNRSVGCSVERLRPIRHHVIALTGCVSSSTRPRMRISSSHWEMTTNCRYFVRRSLGSDTIARLDGRVSFISLLLCCCCVVYSIVAVVVVVVQLCAHRPLPTTVAI